MLSQKPFACFALLVLAGTAACDNPDPATDRSHAGPAMNYRAIDERLGTGGHFVGDGLSELAREGFQVVIDLRDEPPAGQRERLAEKGIEWVPVPVSWERPQAADFDAFKTAMDAHRADKVLVQCAANYRASAMTYLYRVLVDKVPESVASTDLYAVWQPDAKWSAYIETVSASQAIPAE